MKLFEPVLEKRDPKNRIVFICHDKKGFFVMKPSTGFRGTHYDNQDDAGLQESFKRQVECSHNNAFYNDGERPKEGEFPAANLTVAARSTEEADQKAAEEAQAEADKKAAEEAAQAEADKKAAEEAQAEADKKAAEEAQAAADQKAAEEAAQAEADKNSAEETNIKD